LTISGGSLSLASGSTMTAQLGTSFNTTVVSGGLYLNGTLNLTDSGGFTNGTYTLFTYTGTLNTNGLTIGTKPNTNLTYSINTQTIHQVKLVVAPPPVASFTASPTNGTAPSAVTFTDTSIGTITNWFWDLGDSVTTNTATNSLSHTYNAGTYTISLTIWAYGGSSTNTQSNYIVVTNPPPPVAGFSGSPTSGEAPLAVTFTDTSTGNITNRYWDFGDGNTTNTTGTSLSHTYNAGTYTVSLTVSGYGGSGINTQSGYIKALFPPQLVITPASLNFGSATIGHTNSLDFSVVNNGDITLTGTAISTAPFIVTSGATCNVAGRQTQTVTVVFAPETAATFNDTVIFASNGGDSTNAVTGIGLTPGSIAVTPAAQDFGALTTSTAARTTFVVTNSGGTAVSNGTVSVTGPYTILSGATYSIPGFGSTNVVVWFAPVTVGGFTNNVIFASANGGNSTNAVTGTGLAAGNTSGAQQLRPVSLGWVDAACQLALTYDDGGSPDYCPLRLSVTNFGSGVSFVAGHVNFSGSGTRRENIVSAPTFSNSFTIAVWVRWTAGTSWQSIVDDTTTTHGLFVNPPQYVYDSAGGNFSTATMVSNAWTFVAVVVTNYASNSAVQFWINGSKDAVYTNATKVSWAPAFIGSDTGSEAWIGDIDDVFIFSRALSDVEIPQLYQATINDLR
jgi:PKD repeat protein